MSKMETRAVTAGGLRVTTMGLGGTGLGNMYRATDPKVAHDTVHAAFANGLRYFDTAPVYGFSLAESRLGQQSIHHMFICVGRRVALKPPHILWGGEKPGEIKRDSPRKSRFLRLKLM